MNVNVDTDDIKILVDGANKIFLSPEGEQVLIKLYELQEQVEEAIKEAKLRIESEALKLNPQFSSMKSDNLKVMYRQYGSRYRIDESYASELPKELVNIKTTITPNLDAVDDYIEQHGNLPLGLVENQRTKQISISINKNEQVKS